MTLLTCCKSEDWHMLVTYMDNDRFQVLLLHGYTHTDIDRGEDQKKWLDNIRENWPSFCVMWLWTWKYTTYWYVQYVVYFYIISYISMWFDFCTFYCVYISNCFVVATPNKLPRTGLKVDSSQLTFLPSSKSHDTKTRPNITNRARSNLYMVP